MTLNIGDKVKLKNIPFSEHESLFPFCTPNGDGEMDYWAGKVVTIDTFVCKSYKEQEFHIREDGGEWYWSTEYIDYIISKKHKKLNQI